MKVPNYLLFAHTAKGAQNKAEFFPQQAAINTAAALYVKVCLILHLHLKRSLPQAGEYIKADPRCVVSRAAGLELHPPPTATVVDDTGLLDGLKRRIRKVKGQHHQQHQQRQREGYARGDNPLQRLSNALASNATDCLLAPSFPGDIALVSVSGGSGGSGRAEGEESAGTDSMNAIPLQSRPRPRSRSRSRSRSSSGRQSGRTRIDTNTRRPRRSSGLNISSKPHPMMLSTAAGTRDHTPVNKPQRLIVLTQAIVAVGPGVTVKAIVPSEDKRRGGRGGSSSPGPGPRNQRQRGGSAAAAASGALLLSVCEGQGDVAVAGCGKLQKLRLGPGQKRVVDSSRAVAWTSGVTCLAGAGGRTASRSSDSTTTTTTTTTTSSNNNSNNKGATSHSPVSAFVGPGIVYVQTHSLSGLRRLLLPKPGAGAGGSLRGHHGGDVSSGLLFGAGSRGRAALPSHRRGGVVALSLKRGLAKRSKEGAKRVLLGLAFLGLYVVVTSLLLEGRDGLVNAPRHAVQVARSLIKVARRVTMILIRLAREEVWRGGEDGDAVIPEGDPVER